MGLLEKMRISAKSMTLGEKLLGSIGVTLLGMAIVFLALTVLFFTIVIMERRLHKPQLKSTKAPEDSTESVKEEEKEAIDDTELVAVITAAVAASLHTSTHNIVVRNIVRVPDNTPTWGRIGRIDQINTML